MLNKTTNLLYLFRNKIKENKLDGFIIPSSDEFQNEYVPDHLNRLKFITGFSGSNGVALITLNEAIFFTDGRYLLQAEEELGEVFEIKNISTLNDFFVDGIIGYDPKLHTSLSLKKIQSLNLVPSKNLVDIIWQNKPHIKTSQIFKYPLKFSGETSVVKINQLLKHLQNNQLDSIIITDATSICWLLNIRANDVDYNPILLSYLILHNTGEIELFSSTIVKHINLTNYSLNDLSTRLELIKNKRVQLDPYSASIWICSHFSIALFSEDPCLLAKACKNKVEIKHAKRIHVADGTVICKFLYWLEKNQTNQSEISVAKKLLYLRQEHSDFIYPSFPSIAGFSGNGAIIHYNANEKTNKQLEKDGLLLLDSGGQYFGGTTDITRTVPIGKATHEQKHNFTLVLKGHIALAKARFPIGTNGSELDILARQYLWQEEKDYAHGTGHGVGTCLGVHEGPQRIGKMSTCPLKAGMILSNEPGYYKNGEYGIRIENLMLVVENKNNFLSMETLTLAPIERNLILSKMLSSDEKLWLNSYHQKVYNKISSTLKQNEKEWLKQKTSLIS